MRGDRVEVVIDTGDGVRTYDILATRAGRRVEVSTGRGVVEVSEVTRNGDAVRTGRFMASRVLAVVEHPAAEQQAGQRSAKGGPTRAPVAATAGSDDADTQDESVQRLPYEW